MQSEIQARLSGSSDDLLPCLVAAIQAARALEPAEGAAAGLDDVARHSATQLTARLAHPARADNDWSIALPREWHDCPLCKTLAGFLTDPARQRCEWPIAKDKRQHIHSIIDRAELPVLHQTRRTGRPYTLVLTKTDDLFERERQAHRRDTADLAFLKELLKVWS